MGSVDIIIPNYNYSRWLRTAIDSALAQEGVDVRVLVVDNASTDNSVEIVRKVMETDPRVHLCEHAENLGLIASLNDGVDWLKNDYAVLLSADDALTPGSLQRSVTVLDAHPEVSFVYGPVLVHREGNRRPRERHTNRRGFLRIWESSEWLWQAASSGHVCIRSPEVVARTPLVKEIDYSPRLPHTSDMALCLQLAARGSVAHLRGVKQAIYREHPTSLMRTMVDPLITDLIARFDAFDVLVTEDSQLLPRGAELLERARAALATEAVLYVLAAYESRKPLDEEMLPRLLDTARSIWPAITQTVHYRRLGEARARSILSPARVAQVARQEFRDSIRKVRSRELGQWPSYVSS